MKSFQIPEIFKSKFISSIKEKRRVKDKLKKDFSPTVLNFNSLQILIARHFGFCYGVENAIEIAYKTLEENPGKRIFLLSEMIHNQEVNKDLQSRGVEFLMDTQANWLKNINELQKTDIVIVPAFGTTVEIQNALAEIGIDTYQYDTTCPFVEKVWNRAQQIGERGFTVIVHGKPNHEETRATFSHSMSKGPTLIIKNLEETHLLSKYILSEKKSAEFYKDFEGKYSEGFDPTVHLKKIGVVNQTTMLASETQAIADFINKSLAKLETGDFANTRDTLCYATNDNQEATHELLKQDAELAIVVGGYNSSNTTHIVELLEQKLPTFFIKNSDCLISKNDILHYNIHSQQEVYSSLDQFYTAKPKIILTCGASCPDAIVENVLLRLLEFFNENHSAEMILEKI